MVTDFGIAKAVSSSRAATTSGTGLTSIGMSLGTPAYMAPEQAAADPATDHSLIEIVFDVEESKQLDRIIGSLKKIRGVHDVTRVLRV